MKMVKKISTTIKKVYMDQILAGTKKIEYKGNTEFWNKRLIKFTESKNLVDNKVNCHILSYKVPNVVITFLCGSQPYKYKVEKISYVPERKHIDGIIYDVHWQIHLGDRIQ